jgi:N6-L-threonylcarbamoyladenine synthase
VRTPQLISDVSASFQRAAVAAIILKLSAALAAEPQGYRAILAGGGVTANSRLRAQLADLATKHDLKLRLPAMPFCVDNGAMLAGLGHVMLSERHWQSDPLWLTASPSTAA